MTKTTLLLAAVLVAAAFVAIAPTAEAKQACSAITDRTCAEIVCVYDRVAGEWRCAGGEWYPIPCTQHYCW